MKTELYSFIAYLRQERGRSANTVASYEQDLSLAITLFNQAGINTWSAVDRFAIVDLITTMQKQGRAVASINRLLSTLRQFFRYLLQQDELTVNPMELIRQLPTSSDQISVPDSLSQHQMNTLIQSIDVTSPLGSRDRALLAVLYATGMLVSEIIQLRLKHIHRELGIIQFQPSRGQGRIIPLSQASAKFLHEYLTAGRVQLTENHDSMAAVFVNAHGRPLTRQGVWKVIRSRVRQAGLPDHVTAQTIRHTFVTDLLANGASWQGVQALLGQENNNATYANYLKMSSQELIAFYHQYHTELLLGRENSSC